MMTKTDYEVIATAVASTGMGDSTRHELVVNLANALGKKNPRFKRGTFVNMCLGRPDGKLFSTPHTFIK